MDALRGADWLAWRNHPKTQEFLGLMRASVKEGQDNWLDGAFLATDAHATLTNHLLGLGVAQGVNRVAFVIEDIKLEDEDGK